jgi:chromosome segregation ATPase
MNTRIPLTYDDIASACLRLTARGRHPTLRQVRSELGRGSLTTIHDHVTRWLAESRADQGPPHEAIRALEALAPSAVPALREAFRAEQAAAVQQAQEEARTYQAMTDDLTEALASSEQERSELSERLTTMEQRVRLVESLADRLAALGSELAGRLEAHTDHQLRAMEAHADQAEQGNRQVREALQQLAQQLAQSERTSRSGIEAVARLAETVQRQDDSARVQRAALHQELGDARQQEEVHAGRQAASLERMQLRAHRVEALLERVVAARARERASGLPRARRERRAVGAIRRFPG